MKYIVGNWKSNKSSKEVTFWFEEFAKCISSQKINLNNTTIVVCIPYVYLSLAQKLRDTLSLPLKIGAQDVSPFKNGAHTGEVSAGMVSEYAQYVIVGHSERRNECKEDDAILFEKAARAQEVKLTTIYCMQGENTKVPVGVPLVAYEPIWAIGTGQADTGDNAGKVITVIKRKWNVTNILYGGSVTAKNIKDFLSNESIGGVLVGGGSLDPHSFWEMILNASRI